MRNDCCLETQEDVVIYILMYPAKSSRSGLDPAEAEVRNQNEVLLAPSLKPRTYPRKNTATFALNIKCA